MMLSYHPTLHPQVMQMSIAVCHASIDQRVLLLTSGILKEIMPLQVVNEVMRMIQCVVNETMIMILLVLC